MTVFMRNLTLYLEDYELVRVHHPDSPFDHHLSSQERRSRFQAITSAYDTLRGKRGSGTNSTVDVYRQELERRRRARAAYEQTRNSGFAYEHAGRSEWTASADDRWKDRILMDIGVGVRTPFLYSSRVILTRLRE